MPLYAPGTGVMSQRPGSLWGQKWRLGPVVVAPSYTGPGDIVAGATAWYGLRGYNGAYAAPGTNKAINIRRASDNATMDIVIKPDGKLDIATAATFCNATSGFITTWYDQSGNLKNAVQATAAQQPQLIFNDLGVFPGIHFLGTSSMFLSAALGAAPVMPFGFSVVANRNGATSAYGIIIAVGNNQGANHLYFDVSPNTVTLTSSAPISVTASDNAWHAMTGTFVSTVSGNLNIDGAATTGNTGNASIGSFLWMGADTGVSPLYMTGEMTEGGLWPADISASAGALSANQHAYWGF